MNFDERPFIAIWETTQACDLACVHCRACAQPGRHPLELSTNEAKRLIDEVAALQVPVFVLTGGDPLKRPDIFELVKYASDNKFRISLTPSATPLFRSLRDSRNLRDKCGRCEFREICGGSRSRAYALTGDIFAEEPCCVYEPKRQAVEDGAKPVAV